MKNLVCSNENYCCRLYFLYKTNVKVWLYERRMSMGELRQEFRRKGTYEVILEMWQEKLLDGKTRMELVNYIIWRVLKKQDFYGACTRQQIIDEMKEHIPQLFYNKGDDHMNLAQAVYEDGFQKGFIESSIKVLKDFGFYEEFGKDKVREDLINSLMEEEESGIYDRESALEAIRKYAPELMP